MVHLRTCWCTETLPRSKPSLLHPARRLLRKIADAPFSHGLDAFALVDTSPPTLRWADGQFCSRNCRRGACHALAKVARGEDGNAIRCGHRLGAYDAVVAGDVSGGAPEIAWRAGYSLGCARISSGRLRNNL
eukprot:scaffold14015_cov112-Isochrysis_galbana.AAC.12